MDTKPKSQVERNREWREKHPEAYREYMRRYMRDYRAGLRRRVERDDCGGRSDDGSDPGESGGG